jgi:hypothetical protein
VKKLLWIAALFGSLSIAALDAATPVSLSAPNVTVPENVAGGLAPFKLIKTAGSSYSKVSVQLIDGTAKAGVDYRTFLGGTTTVTLGNRAQTWDLPIGIIDNGTFQGTRTFTAKITCLRNCRVLNPTATITITDNEVAPPPPPVVTWTKCADEGGTCYVARPANVRYGAGTTWTVPRSVAASISCSNDIFGDPLVGTGKQCQTDGTPGTPPPPPPVQCPDGSTVPAGQVCPSSPPLPQSWVAAPLHDGGFARVRVVSDPKFEIAGAGSGRPLVAGEIVAVYFNGWGVAWDNRTTFAVYALTDGSAGRAYAADLDGLAPSGNPPLPPANMGLPADWWVPGLVTANKTCPNAYDATKPGVTQGAVYRAGMMIGTHTALAPGVTGSAGAVWTVFAAGDPWQGARLTVRGDCLTGAATTAPAAMKALVRAAGERG